MFDHFDPLSLGFDPVYPDSKAHICFIKHFLAKVEKVGNQGVMTPSASWSCVHAAWNPGGVRALVAAVQTAMPSSPHR